MVFAQRVLDAVEKHGPNAVEELEDERAELIAKLGENIVVRDAVRYEAEDGDVLTAYVHPPANKLGVLVHARGDGDQAYRMAMHIAASPAAYVSRDDVPEAEIDAEKEILAKQPDVQEKPERGAREDRRGPDPEVARGDRARGPGLDPRADRKGRRGARTRRGSRCSSSERLSVAE